MKLIDWDFYKYDAADSGFNSILLLIAEDDAGVRQYAWLHSCNAHRIDRKEAEIYARGPREWITRRPTPQHLALTYLQANTPVTEKD